MSTNYDMLLKFPPKAFKARFKILISGRCTIHTSSWLTVGNHDWLSVDTSGITFGIIIENLDERIFARSNATFLQGINPKY